MIKVIFFKEKSGEVFAYFPDLTADDRGNKTMYSKQEGLSSCSKEYLIGREVATPEEYTLLRYELKEKGYPDLEILNELPTQKKSLGDIYLNFIW